MRRRYREQPLRRSGCATCKSRHKKCDERKPRCGNCIRLNLECKPSDLFRALNPSRSKTARGFYFNSFADVALYNTAEPYVAAESYEVPEAYDAPESPDIPESSHAPESSDVPGSYDEAEPWDLDETADAFSDKDNDFDRTTPSSTLSTPHLDLFQSHYAMTLAGPQTSPLERYLLDHYVNIASTVLINVDSPSNPLRSVLVPRAVTSPILMDALYATAAFHVFVCNHDPEFRTTSLTYYSKAASALSRLIADVGFRTSGKDLEILLLTAVFLCKYEIISVGSNWRPHLQGVRQTLEFCQNNESEMAPETLSYVQSFITYHSCIAGITRINKSPSPLASPACEESETVAGVYSQIDPYMGVSGDLISLLNIAAETAMLDFSDQSNSFSTMCTVIKIHERIRSHAPASVPCLSAEHVEETIVRLNTIADAYKNVLVVYLHIILDSVAEGSASNASALEYSRVRNLIAMTKDEAISACIQDTMLIPDDSSCVVGLVPILFIAASETKSPTEFDIASKRLSTIFKTACLRNVGTALELLYKMQRIESVHWRQILKCCEWDLIVT